MEVVRLAITEETVRLTGVTEEVVRITGVSEVGPRGPKGDHGDYSPDAVVAVLHGSNANYPRPAGPNVVFWFGTIVPINANDFDHVFLPDTVIV